MRFQDVMTTSIISMILAIIPFIVASPLETSGYLYSSKGPSHPVPIGHVSNLLLSPFKVSPLIRGVRSVAGETDQTTDPMLDTEETIQPNGRTEEDPETAQKSQRSSFFHYPPWTPEGQTKSIYPSGFGRVARGGHSNYIRLGRNILDFDYGGYGFSNVNKATKKNNFIRLGRENPRRNNFIRLGRSGLMDNNDRFGSNTGYFQDYYHIPTGSVNPGWGNGAVGPLPYDNIFRQG